LASGRLIGLDVGEKRTGIAVTDPLCLIASPLKGIDSRDLNGEIDRLIAAEPCRGIVIGLPIRLHGEVSAIETFIEKWTENLKKRHPHIAIHRQDERFTSKIASRALYESGVPKNKRRDKYLIDSTSAAVILQSFLDKEKS
jgi:putative Holliday junction resolvase